MTQARHFPESWLKFNRWDTGLNARMSQCLIHLPIQRSLKTASGCTWQLYPRSISPTMTSCFPKKQKIKYSIETYSTLILRQTQNTILSRGPNTGIYLMKRSTKTIPIQCISYEDFM